MAVTLTATYATEAELIEHLGFTIDDCPLTSDQVKSALNRAQDEVNRRTDTKFYDGTADTPGYEQVTSESHTGKGQCNLNYYLRKYPIPELKTDINGAITADDATITVVSTQGFPSSGYILIEDNKISYTGKTATTFTGCSNVDAHDDGLEVTNVIIEVSTTSEGQTVSFRTLDKDKQINIEHDSGALSLYNSSVQYTADTTTFVEHPSYQVANRLNATYVWGWSYIPLEITNVTLMIAAKNLMYMIVRKATINGLNDFNPAMINIDEEYIKETILRYKSYKQQVI